MYNDLAFAPFGEAGGAPLTRQDDFDFSSECRTPLTFKGAECDRSNFRFIVPFTTDRAKWGNLVGINLHDGQSYATEMYPSVKQDKVIPESLRIMLKLYLRRPESKSLAPTGVRAPPTPKGC